MSTVIVIAASHKALLKVVIAPLRYPLSVLTFGTALKFIHFAVDVAVIPHVIVTCETKIALTSISSNVFSCINTAQLASGLLLILACWRQFMS